MPTAESLVPIERIEGLIFLIRGQKVMLDRDLAQLYGVETRVPQCWRNGGDPSVRPGRRPG